MSGFLVGLRRSRSPSARRSRPRLLGLDGLFGLNGWQIMYIAEAMPTVVMGIVTLFVLTDRPEQANFLTAEEKDWLAGKLAAERKAKEAVDELQHLAGHVRPKVLLLSLNYFGIVTASLGMLFFIPQIIKSLGVTSNMTVGWLTMIPYICGAHRAGGVGRDLRPDAGAAMEPACWPCILSTVGLVIAGHDDGHLVGAVRHDVAAWASMAPRGRSGRCRRCS